MDRDKDLFEHESRTETEKVLRVAELNRAVRFDLEEKWSDVWVQGELSDVTKASSGHFYFTLNDEVEPAQIRCVIFRGDAKRIKTNLENGARVKAKGSLSLYEPRGMFQMIARIALPAGEGNLAARFEKLRKKLAAEGLFDLNRKRPLPLLPRIVGVVTSLSGAALHDILRVSKGRCPVRLVIADCRVQGAGASETIVQALQSIQRLPDLDVIILARGGGSSEDLWVFNDEQVARAIANCRVPVVTGVGHEIDVTIADLVADVRGATPSNATELVVCDRHSYITKIESHRRHLQRALEVRIGRDRLRLERLIKALLDPRLGLASIRRELETSRSRLLRLMQARVRDGQEKFTELTLRLARRDPRSLLLAQRNIWNQLTRRMQAAPHPLLRHHRENLFELSVHIKSIAHRISERRRFQITTLIATLDAMSPLKVLSRGYAIALHDNKAIIRASDVAFGDWVTVRVAEGQFEARVTGSKT